MCGNAESLNRRLIPQFQCRLNKSKSIRKKIENFPSTIFFSVHEKTNIYIYIYVVTSIITMIITVIIIKEITKMKNPSKFDLKVADGIWRPVAPDHQGCSNISSVRSARALFYLYYELFFFIFLIFFFLFLLLLLLLLLLISFFFSFLNFFSFVLVMPFWRKQPWICWMIISARRAQSPFNNKSFESKKIGENRIIKSQQKKVPICQAGLRVFLSSILSSLSIFPFRRSFSFFFHRIFLLFEHKDSRAYI